MSKIIRNKLCVMIVTCLVMVMGSVLAPVTFSVKGESYGFSFDDSISVGTDVTRQINSMRYYSYVPSFSGSYNFAFRFASYCDADIFIYDENYNKIYSWDPCVYSGTKNYLISLEANKTYYIYYKGNRAFIDMTISMKNQSGNNENGTSQPEKPYLTISSIRELNEFSQKVNNGNDYEGKLIQLTADIAYDSTMENNFVPIGTFKGTFDGGNHTISGINIVKKGDTGLFSSIADKGNVKNVILKNICINGETAGIVAGRNAGTIENIEVESANVSSYISEALSNTYIAGGIAGENGGTINNCQIVDMKITGTDEKIKNTMTMKIGGIAGKSSSSSILMNSSVQGNIQVVSSKYNKYITLGGIAGENYTGKVYNCNNVADISYSDIYENSISGNIYAGGIAGDLSGDSIVENCYNVGNITVSNKNDKNDEKIYIGGIVGRGEDKTQVSNCYTSIAASSSNFGSMKGTEKDNKALSTEEMKTTAFAEQLNSNIGENGTWLQWELRSEAEYPLLANLVDISNCKTELASEYYSYSGEMIEPAINLIYKDIILKEGVDYSIVYENNKNAGTAKIIITGQGRYIGTITKTFTIKSREISECVLTLDTREYVYDGTLKKPSVSVQDRYNTLGSSTDYTVSYANNKNAGMAVVTVKGVGNYTGELTKTYKIKKADQEIYYDSGSYSVKRKSKAFKISVKRTVGNGKLTFKSSNTKVASVSTKGKVTAKKQGKAVITITAAATQNYNKKSVKIIVYVSK